MARTDALRYSDARSGPAIVGDWDMRAISLGVRIARGGASPAPGCNRNIPKQIWDSVQSRLKSTTANGNASGNEAECPTRTCSIRLFLVRPESKP